MKNKLFILFFLFFCITAAAQLQPCKPPLINDAVMRQAESFQRNGRVQAVDRLIRVYFKIFRDNNGFNAAATLAQIELEFQQLQTDYAPNNICFANMGVDFINNTQANTMLNPDSNNHVLWLVPFMAPGCITIFYHANLTGVGGSAYNIPNDFFSVDRNFIGDKTISHEMGHCLGLLHTHESAYGLEYINGTECSIRGDRVCDTPADPWVWNGGLPCFSTNGCQYTGNCIDPNGSINYSPPYNNMMSYWRIAGCDRTTITVGQNTRVNSFLTVAAVLASVQSPSSFIYGPANVSSGIHAKSAIYGLTTSGNISISNSAIVSLQAQSLTMLPGFTASPVSGSVTIKPTSCNY